MKEFVYKTFLQKNSVFFTVIFGTAFVTDIALDAGIKSFYSWYNKGVSKAKGWCCWMMILLVLLGDDIIGAVGWWTYRRCWMMNFLVLLGDDIVGVDIIVL